LTPVGRVATFAIMPIIAGTCVAMDGRGVLLRGPSGAGKLDLAIRLMESGARLVADDQVFIEIENEHLVASAPEAVRGMIEARGLGVLQVVSAPPTPLVAVIDLVPADEIDRMPDPASVEIESVPLPLFRLAPFEPSALAKVRLAVRLATGGIMRVP